MSRRPPVAGAVTVAVLAAATTSLVYGLVRLAGTDVQVGLPDGTRQELTVLPVALATLVPALLGGLAFAAVLGRLRRAVPLMQVGATALTLLSLAGPLTLDVDTTSRAVLCLLHVVAGAVVVTGLTLVARRAGAADAAPSVALRG